jgi:hypothetical protein
MVRTRAFRRAQRGRVIRKRLRVIWNAWGYGFRCEARVRRADGTLDDPWWYPWRGREGALDTSNLRDCTCWMCAHPAYDRVRQRREDRRARAEGVAEVDASVDGRGAASDD